MQRLIAVSYPQVSAEAEALIRAFRRQHDVRHRDLAAHFTLVFGCAWVGLQEYTNHVAEVAASTPGIRFSCRYAMLGADDEDDTAYVFLVPDQGYAAISLLHDRLYTGPLEAHLRLDLPYVPHITIGAMKNRSRAKALCDDLNTQRIRVDGTLAAVTIVAAEDRAFRDLSTHALNRPTEPGAK